MQIATWNVNSIKARTDAALAWLKEASPDVVCLQEIKCEDSAFPSALFEDLGYNVVTHGQKTYNGVATALEAAARGRAYGPARRQRRHAGPLH